MSLRATQLAGKKHGHTVTGEIMWRSASFTQWKFWDPVSYIISGMAGALPVAGLSCVRLWSGQQGHKKL